MLINDWPRIEDCTDSGQLSSWPSYRMTSGSGISILLSKCYIKVVPDRPRNNYSLKGKIQVWNCQIIMTYIEAKREVSRISNNETIQNCFRCVELSLESQADAIEDNNIRFKLLQSRGQWRGQWRIWTF